MIKPDRKLKELESRLKGRNESAVIEAVDWLRNVEPFTGAIQMLAALFDTSENEVIKNSITGFMDDLKALSARTEVMEEIKKPYKPDTIHMLVSSCWQSGLDYSEYASDFAMTFNSGDYLTALECFTVLEESSHSMTRKAKDRIIEILRINEGKIQSEKSALLLELLSVLS